MNAKAKTILSSLVVASLIANVVILAGLVASTSTQVGTTAMAQSADVIISTSADDHDKRFFGESALQVVITDRNANDDDDDVIVVRLTAESRESNGGDSGTFTIPNTSPGSQKFEFYLVHAASQYADGIADDSTELDPQNSEGFDDLANGFDGIGAPIIRFGTDVGDGVELATGDDLYGEVKIEIGYDDEEITVSYEETRGQLTSDRERYGSDNLVYLLIRDQDANLNPTEFDSFTVTDDDLDALFGISGASFVDDVVFEESGYNTAIFEGRFQLAPVDTANDDPAELTVESSVSSISLTLEDRRNYGDVAAIENDSSNTDDINFTIENEDGSIDDMEALTFGNELRLTVRDNDQNKDSQDDETLQDAVSVKVGTGDSNNNGIFDLGEADQESIDIEETQDNSGVFVIDSTNNELKITFLADGSSPIVNNGILELRKSDIDRDINIAYTDPLDEDSNSSVTSSFNRKIELVIGTVDVPDSAGLNDKFVLTIADGDLNDNPRAKESYTFTLTGNSGTYGLKRGGSNIVQIATIELEIAGRTPTFAIGQSYTLVETEINNGIFTSTLDMRNILTSAGIDADDGDKFRVTYNDLMGKTSRESSDILSIGRSSTAIDFSRAVLPIPPEDDPSDLAAESSVGGFVGTTVVTTLVVTDVRENTRSSSEETIEFDFRNDPGSPRPAFSIRVEGNGIRETIDTSAKYDGSDATGELGNTGSFLIDILPDLPTLRETGKSTGVFEEELEFVNDGALDTDDWHNLKIVITYYNDINDDESAGITFRGNSGTATTDKGSVRSGERIVITVQDEDMNLDDSEIEEFTNSRDTDGFFILAIAPEDDEMEMKSVSTKTFRETGPNTGIFTAIFVVGSEIPVTEDEGNGDEVEINQATLIEITYNDEIDATGSSGDEMELAIPVVTSAGAIQIMPEDGVGPGTKITILIIDNDLNMNPRGTDKFEGDNEGDGIVVFRTDRRDAGRASPDLHETGPNTGVFTFEIQLVPIEGGDDGQPIEVQGGSEPRIGVLPGSLIAIRYEDENNDQGKSMTVTKVIEVKSWDPMISGDKELYEENDRVVITITDPDANRDSDIADSIRGIRVYSDNDRVGKTYSALETQANSGTFKLAFSMTTGTSAGAISARNGDEVTIQYEDEFPSDYSERLEQVNNPDKKFLHSFVVGVSKIGTGSTTPLPPALKDISGNELNEAIAGQQVVLTTTIKNNNAKLQPFTAIIEVRNSQGLTMSLDWQTGALNPSEVSEIGISWVAPASGNYHVRTFVISGFEVPQVLSPVATSEVKVKLRE